MAFCVTLHGMANNTVISQLKYNMQFKRKQSNSVDSMIQSLHCSLQNVGLQVITYMMYK